MSLTKIIFATYQILIAVDQLLNTLIGGWADETLSSAAYRSERQGYFWGKLTRPSIDTIFFWQDNHCYNAYLSERNRLQSPPEDR